MCVQDFNQMCGAALETVVSEVYHYSFYDDNGVSGAEAFDPARSEQWFCESWADPQNESQEGERFKWTGREFDCETGMQHNRARYCDPGTGRWMNADPLGFEEGDTNLFRYCSPDVIMNAMHHIKPE
jgi:RHS repeat-associated protein